VGGIDPNRSMSWDKAQEWIAAMNAANCGGVNDWRLWSERNSDGSGPCEGLDGTDSELSLGARRLVRQAASVIR
jgi:hypothetical protein